MKDVFCSMENFCFFYTRDSVLLVVGENRYGQLGLGTNEPKFVAKATVLMNDPEVKSIALGYSHSLILRKNGELFGMGNNLSKQLSLEDTSSRFGPTLLMKDESIRQVMGLTIFEITQKIELRT